MTHSDSPGFWNVQEMLSENTNPSSVSPALLSQRALTKSTEDFSVFTNQAIDTAG